MKVRYTLPQVWLVVIAIFFFASSSLVGQVVISQVYGGGNNSSAPYQNDFIELFNRGVVPINLNGWSVQYTSSSGTSWTNKVDLPNFNLQPGQYFLIRLAGGTTNGIALPTADATGTINMSGTSGKVALVNSTTVLTGSGCPMDASVLDFVGYGTADCREGASAAPALSNTTAAIRQGAGCTDTNSNSADFTATAPNPRNSASPFNVCSNATFPNLLLSEIVVTPTAGEFIEIYNPNPFPVDLSNVYLTDATFTGSPSTYYYNIVTGINAGGGGFGDFLARFPAGAIIPAGAYQTVALNGSDDFFTTYGVQPTYELYEDAMSADGIPDMREGLPGSINNQGGLTNDGEIAILFYWDGTSDLVKDLDYALWGDKAEAVDKSGISIDGPDANATTSAYLNDTPISSQEVISASAHASGSSYQRIDLTEGTETKTGGNGANGHNETSENLSVTWGQATVTPNAMYVAGPPPPPPPPPVALIINEILADPDATNGDANGDGTSNTTQDEFVEIYNDSGADVDISGWTLSDGVQVRHTFPTNTIISKDCAIVIFGGGTPTGKFGGAATQIASTGSLGLNNGGDVVTLMNGATVIASYTYGSEGGDNQSLTRDPDITGATPLVKHSTATGAAGRLFSAGSKVNGTRFSGCPVQNQSVVINEVDSDTPGIDEAEFVELFDGGTGNTALDGLVLVFFNGNDDLSYAAFDLDGYTTDANGYFVLGNAAVPGVDLIFANNLLQNGADAVALYRANATDFPTGTAVTTANLQDALVYDTTDPDDSGLLVLLNANQVQVDENANGSQVTQSMQRIPNGQGGQRNTATYLALPPTPDGVNFLPVFVHDVQGNGLASPLVGSFISLDAIVTLDFQASSNSGGSLQGFYLQEEDIDADADPLSSEGIFVYDPGLLTDVAIGDRVRIVGKVTEFNGLTEITDLVSVTIVSSGNVLPTVTNITLPTTAATDLEPYEGMLVKFPQTLTVTGNQDLGRFGEIFLSANGRQAAYTQINAPGPGALPYEQAQALYRILLDDTLNGSYRTPVYHLLANADVRGGDEITNLCGVLDYAFGQYRVRPTVRPVFSAENPRPAPPALVCNLPVGNMNLLNYFNGVNGVFTTSNSRGALNPTQFAEQRAKTIQAILGMSSAIIGVQELENDGFGSESAIQDLVNGLNAATGPGTYAFIDPGVPQIGTDQITVGILYQPALVTPVGPAAILATPSSIFNLNRPFLAQTFQLNSLGEKLTIAVVHLKSKGGPPSSGPNIDMGDGQAAWNLSRVQAAQALADWLATDPTNSGDPDFLLMGDFNAYALEDPLTLLATQGYQSLLSGYSYQFNGYWGSLDHMLASACLAGQLTSGQKWHINADESPTVFSYNQGVSGFINTTDPFSSSDHDPLVSCFDLRPVGPVLAADTVTICSGDVSSLVLASLPLGPDATNFELLAVTYSNVTTSAGGVPTTFPFAFTDVNELADDQWENATGNVELVIYEIRAYSADGCPGPVASYGVYVLPELSVSDTVMIMGVDVAGPQDCDSFEMTLDVTVKNTGYAPLDNIDLDLDLSDPDAFGPAFGGIVVPPAFVPGKSLLTSNNPLNGAYPTLVPYNGTGDLVNDATGLLNPGDSITIRLTILVHTPDAPAAIAKSTVSAEGNYEGDPLWPKVDPTVRCFANDATETAVGNCPALSCGLTAHKDVTVTMDENCGACITASMLIPSHDASCELPLGGYYQILIEGYGTFSDTVCLRRDMFQTEKVKFLVRSVACACDPVWGYLHLEDKTGPVAVSGKSPPTFECTEIDKVLNVTASWMDSKYGWYIAPPTFRDNCCPASSIKLKVSDAITYHDCDYIQQTDVYATIKRTYIPIDCYGNQGVTFVHEIRFNRPDAKYILTNAAEVIEKNVCDGNVNVQAIMKEHLSWKERGITYNLFDLQCNFSTTISKTTTFDVCTTGKKIEVEVEIFDWCAKEVIARKTFLIKAYDQEAPKIAYKGGEISTGPMDCTATLPLDDAGLEKALGVKVTDNCSANITKSYKVESRDIVLYGIPVDQGDYLPANYPIITVGGKQAMIGIPLGRHRLLIDAFDGCYNTATATVEFTVVDKVAPVMKCDDKLNITLTRTPGDYYAGDKGLVYGKASVADVDEGTFDNCTLTSIKVRRIVSKDCLESGYFDGNWDYDLNNDKNIRNDFTEIKEGPHAGSYYSPLLDYVEFFCCDLGSDVVIELWGEDNNKNRSYCWLEIHLEDKVTPSCTAPATQYVKCTDKETRAKIYDELESNKIWGAPLITGLECSGTVVYSVDSSLHCDAGYYTRSWTAVRTVKGVEVKSKLCEQKVVVLPVHEYDIKFPADVEVACGALSTVPGVEYYELGCDVLAVNVKDSEYFADAEGEACYKVFRTYTVINWCEFEEWNTHCTDAIDPMNFAQVAPRTWDQNGDGDTKDTYDIPTGTGYWLLVRDMERNNVTWSLGDKAGMNGVEEFFLSKDRTPMNYNSTGLHERVFPPDLEFFYQTQPNNAPSAFPFDDPSVENFCVRWVPTGYPDTEGLIPANYYPETVDGWQDDLPTFAWQYTQVIKVFDKVPPTVEVPTLDKFATDPETCVAKVTIPFVANDSCGGAAVKVNLDRVQVAPGQSQTTLLNPATFQSNWTLANGTMRTATGFSVTIANLPEGTHDLVVTVRDDCGNVTVKRIPFTVADCKGPAPTCIEGLTMPLMPTPEGEGMMAVWATDFIASPIYDCNGQGEVNPANSKQKKVTKFSINRVGEDVDETQTGIVLSCADFLANPKVAVEIHAWDTKGNHSFCTTYVQLTDPNGLCTAGPSAAIAGIIQTEGKAEVEGVDVSLSGGAAMNYATSLNGQYQFNGLTTGADYTVAPKLNKGFLNGVSTFDLVLLQKHILNVQPITSPYKLIAADANNSRTITTLDMIQLRKLILNIDRELANNTSWRFVDASFVFPNPANPWQTPFPEVKNINNLTGEQRANFVGIKIGDLNGNAVANSTMASVRSFQGNWTITTAEQQLTAGNEYRIEFTAPTSQIEGYQFTLNFDQTKVELIDIESGIAQDEHFGVFAEEGMITTSWNGEAKDGTLFTLILRARADATLSEVIHLGGGRDAMHRVPTMAEAYQGTTLLNVGLAFSHAIQPQGQFGLYQNIPNPFQGQTLIGFTLPEASDATITIQDVTGRTLRVINGQYAKGYNEIRLTRNDISRNVASATGVLYYTLTAGSQTATRKMVIVE
ncbi:MAG: ExeM/NucH family extracellular endonuclease [Lewinellaceae bacterium]|nr:ExeM/NucH family extracellular endonuclease [Lewinellaceae bacterium]